MPDVRRETVRVGKRDQVGRHPRSAHLERNGQSRFTVPPQLVSALHRALVELDEEGLAGRQARYEESMRVLIAGLDELGKKWG